MRVREFEADEKIRGRIQSAKKFKPEMRARLNHLQHESIVDGIRNQGITKEDRFEDEVSRVNGKYERFLNRMNIHKLQKEVDMTKRQHARMNSINYYLDKVMVKSETATIC